MSLNLNWPGWTWLEHTGELAGYAFALTLYSVWQTAPSPDLGSINWSHALSQAGYEALGAVLLATVSLKVKNGTGSFIRKVVAADKAPKPDSAPVQ
jgi:hypothetical protein